MNNPDKLATHLIESLTDLINSNAADIAHRLSTTADGKLSVTFGARLVQTPGKVLTQTRIRFADVKTATISGSLDWCDPNQMEIGGVE
jgi:hypothetical protein